MRLSAVRIWLGGFPGHQYAGMETFFPVFHGNSGNGGRRCGSIYGYGSGTQIVADGIVFYIVLCHNPVCFFCMEEQYFRISYDDGAGDRRGFHDDHTCNI